MREFLGFELMGGWGLRVFSILNAKPEALNDRELGVLWDFWLSFWGAPEPEPWT